MSLHTLANHLQSAGRGEDKVLVHMTPGEVQGLQSLAMAQGGSLSINPETGLPEAGILSSLLPMIAGFALGPAGFQLMSAAQAGLAVGALTGVATGSLKQGIMAGLGAYGGAGLGQGLMAQGATPAAAPAGAGLNPNATKIGLQNTGATVGLKAPVFEPSVVNSNMGLTGYQPSMASGLTNVPSGMTSTQLNQSLLNPQVNFATGMKLPTAAANSAGTYLTPGNYDLAKNLSGSGVTAPTVNPTSDFSLADRQSLLNRAGEQVGGYDVTGGVSKVYRPPSLLDLKAGARQSFPDLSTLKENGGYVRTPDGRFFIENPLQRSSVAKVPGYTPSTATTTQQFAGKMPSVAQPSNAIDVSAAAPSTSQLGRGFSASTKDFAGLKGLYDAMPQYSVLASGIALADAMKPEDLKEKKDKSLIRPYEFDYGSTNVSGEPYTGSAERTYFNPVFTARTPYESPGPEYAAAGGLMGYAVGGPVEDMAAMNAIGANTGYPMANLQTPMYSNPAMQRPEATNVIAPSADAGVGAYSGEARFASGGETQYGRPVLGTNPGHVNPENQARAELAGGRRPSSTAPTAPNYKYSYDPKTMQFTQAGANGAVTGGITQPAMQPAMQAVRQPTNPAQPLIPNINIPAYQTPEQQLGLGGFYDMMNQQLGGYGGYQGYAAGGGVSHLGDYSDGGRLLKGPGDGVSDSIPASIGSRQPARLADGEFVVPARIVSEIGNGSTEAGARKLYAMMDRVQKARGKTVGKNQVARNTKAEKLLPA